MSDKLPLEELIAAVKAAKTKDALEKLVLEQIGVDIDKRRNLGDLRAEVLAGLSDEPQADDEQIDEELPDIEDVHDAPAKPSQRLMRHKKTGRMFVWTPILAKLPDLEEI